ncbi:AGAP010571-PA-like protein [Anopheles sinensis]|uniref:AGAP010571-PA-like protein n=1 Tax=Anopheles sinensis TaxID=74873 RepID=A0A084VIC5_ANOSI|nr:AGAP010571-PA-like protein [Anopheles sinensis]
MDRLCRKIQNIMVNGNLSQLKQLVEDVEGDSSIQNLCQAYAELKHRNIALTAEIVQFVEYELIKASYQHTPYQAAGIAKNDELSSRTADMVKCIDLIVKHHQTGLYTDIDESFVHRLRQTYAHVFFLKTHHRKLPLLQLQFCIGVFLKVVTGKPTNGFDIYAFTIDKVRLIRFLKLTRDELVNPPAVKLTFQQYTGCVMESLKSPPNRPLRGIPKRVRTFIRDDIRKNGYILSNSSDLKCAFFGQLSPQLQACLKAHYEKMIEWDRRHRSKTIFKELNDTYYSMKQHYSILKILTYIDGMQDGGVPASPIVHPPMSLSSRIRAIKRTLQVIGETIKSTRETPNITVKLKRVLQLITSNVLTERTTDLRQFFSHGYPLSKWELERDDRGQPTELAPVFQKIETNLREARHWFVYTRAQQNFRIYRQYLGHLRGFTSVDALRDYVAFVGTEFKANLIELFLPEHLTEAKRLVEKLLRDFVDPPSSGESVRKELEYIPRELEHRIVAIRGENYSIVRSMDEFFFLESYTQQPTVCLDRVREIVDWILASTRLADRHKLVQKTDLMFARELIDRLQTAEQDEKRKYQWGNVLKLLEQDTFRGIDALISHTEPRIDVTLKETMRTLQALGLPLENEEYLEFANRRLSKSYYPNVFVLDNKYRVLKELIKDRRVQVNTRAALEKLKEARKTDEQVLQQMFDDLLDSMAELLNRSEDIGTGKLSSNVDHIALEYCLLEVSEILCNIGLFRDNVANLNRFKLYNVVPNSLKHPTVEFEEGYRYKEIFNQQTTWIEQQVDFLYLINNFHTHALAQVIEQVEAEENSANLLLMRRSYLEQDSLSIALDENHPQFIEHALKYEARNDNFFHLVINFSKCYQLKENVKILIQDPHMFCFRLALKYGLIDIIRNVHRQCNEVKMQKSIVTELGDIFNRLPREFLFELMNLLPSEWFRGVADHLKNTILHWAALRGDEQLLRFLLDRHRTLINEKNNFGDVPLLLALRYHGNVIAQLLLDYGADPCVDVKIIQTIARRNNRDLLGRLQNQWSRFHLSDSTENHPTNPLRAALEGNHFEMFVMLHRSFGYGVQCPGLLHLAALLNRVDFLKYMLTVMKAERELEANIDLVNAVHRFTPLMIALASGHYESAQILLQHGANGLFRNENSYCPWHCAVHSGNNNILSLLLPLPGLDVNLLTRDKRSALIIAMENEQSTTQIETLLRAGVVIRSEDVLRACLEEDLATLKLLIDRSPEFLAARDFLQRTPLFIAVVLRNEAMVQFLLDRGANIDEVNSTGMNVLPVAVFNNSTHICRKLLSVNVKINAVDDCGRTPLVIALENEHLGVAEMLVQFGALLESVYQFRYPSYRNGTLLHKFTVENRPWMVEYLINKFNFPTDVKDDDRKTAAMYSVILPNVIQEIKKYDIIRRILCISVKNKQQQMKRTVFLNPYIHNELIAMVIRSLVRHSLHHRGCSSVVERSLRM